MKIINRGTEYGVFKYKENSSHVMKLPITDGKRYYEGRVNKVLRHEQILREKLPEQYIHSKIRNHKAFKYVLRQKFIKGNTLHLYNLENVVHQYEYLLKIRKQIAKEHSLRIDFFGKKGLLNLIQYYLFLKKQGSTELSNNLIIEESNGKLCLIDNGMIELNTKTSKTIDFISIQVSQALIQFYKLKIKLRNYT